MFKKKLFFVCLIMAIFFSSFVYATDDVMLISSDESTDTSTNWIDSDVNLATENYLLDTTIVGNAFIAGTDFTMNPKNGGGVITGNLFVMANTVKLESDFTYSSKPLEDGSYEVENINSASVISGNAFVLADTFILEPGAEIDGDLYVVANTIELNKGSIVRGNVFATGTNVTTDASIGQSLYVSSENFNMSSAGFVYRDMTVSADTSNIDGKINRNTHADIKNLSVGSNFKVSGNLEYSSENQLELSKGIVNGEIKYSKYSDENLGNSILSIVFGLISSVFYIIVVSLLFKFICDKKSLECKNDIDFKNLLRALGIGLASIFLVTLLSIILLISSFTATLGILLALAYVLILLVSTPILVYYIAQKVNIKSNIYLSISAIAAALYLLTLIPIVGPVIEFIFTVTGTGMIIMKLFRK